MGARTLAVSPRSELDNGPDNANILVCGGGGVGMECTKLLKDMGSWVWMLQRTEVRIVRRRRFPFPLTLIFYRPTGPQEGH